MKVKVTMEFEATLERRGEQGMAGEIYTLAVQNAVKAADAFSWWFNDADHPSPQLRMMLDLQGRPIGSMTVTFTEQGS